MEIIISDLFGVLKQIVVKASSFNKGLGLGVCNGQGFRGLWVSSQSMGPFYGP